MLAAFADQPSSRLPGPVPPSLPTVNSMSLYGRAPVGYTVSKAYSSRAGGAVGGNSATAGRGGATAGGGGATAGGATAGSVSDIDLGGCYFPNGARSPVHQQWCVLLAFAAALTRTLAQHIDVSPWPMPGLERGVHACRGPWIGIKSGRCCRGWKSRRADPSDQTGWAQRSVSSSGFLSQPPGSICC